MTNDIHTIYIWYTPLYEVVLVGRDLVHLLVSLGINPHSEADYLADLWNSPGPYSGIGSVWMFCDRNGKAVIDALDKAGEHYVIKKDSVPRFHEERWRTMNQIKDNKVFY